MDIGIACRGEMINSDTLSLMYKIGYRYIDFGFMGQYFMSDHFTLRLKEDDALEKLKIQKEVLDSAKIRVSQTHAPFSWELVDRKDLDDLIEATKQSIVYSDILETPYLVVHPLRYAGAITKYFTDKYELNIYFLNQVLAFAENYKVQIALENFPMDIGDTIEEHLKLFDLIANDKLVACFDTGHSFFAKNDIVRHIIALGDKLKVLHIHDNYGDYDWHNPIFYGKIDWGIVMQALRDIQYQGVFSVEPVYKVPDNKQIIVAELYLHYANAKYIVDKFCVLK